MIQLKRMVRRIAGIPAPYGRQPAREGTYRHLFLRDLATLGLADDSYPTGGAANYSLLYLILRTAIELRPASVLDIGAGQSSLLWSKLRRLGLVGQVTTIEDDSEWGARIRAQVDHEVLVTPLRPVTAGPVPTLSYDWTQAALRGPFDVIVNDGPRGRPRFSRMGLLALLDAALPSNFVIIIDDAERAGEQDMIRAVHDRLQAMHRAYLATEVCAAKCQAVFAAGEYLRAGYF